MPIDTYQKGKPNTNKDGGKTHSEDVGVGERWKAALAWKMDLRKALSAASSPSTHFVGEDGEKRKVLG